jgi:hypothetical protein
MFKSAYFIKSGLIFVLLGLESYFLTNIIFNYVIAGNYFSFNLNNILSTICLMCAIITTFSLSIGTWYCWHKYVIGTLPLVLGMIYKLVLISNGNLIIYDFIFLFILVISLEIWRSNYFFNILIRFEPKLILKNSAGSILIMFSILAGLMSVLTTSTEHTLNLGKSVSDLVGDNINQAVENQVNGSLQKELAQQNIDLNNLDPSVSNTLKQLGLPTNITPNQIGTGINTKDIIEKQVNTFVEPYKVWIKPLIVLLVFSTFQFYAFFALFLYNIICPVIFVIAKKTGFFITETIKVDKEIIKY